MSEPIPPVVQPPLAVFLSFSGTGGVERMVVNLIRGFVDLGQSVDLLTVRAEGPHIERLPARVNHIRLGKAHTQLAIPALARYLRRTRPAALLVAKDRAGRAAVIARMLAGTDTRILLRLGTNLSTAMAGRSAFSKWIRYGPIRLLYPMIDRIVAVSDGVAEDTAVISGVPRCRISVIRNPVITPELYIQASEPCPHPWFREAGRCVLLGAGRLQRQKDFPTLLRAFAEVRRSRRCRLVILGEGAQRSRLQRLIEELGIGEDVDLPGFQANPYPFMKNAVLFVLSSAWEGSPNALTEAMALGTPVVSTDCPSGPRELLNDGRYGPLTPVGDVAALAQGILKVLQAPPAQSTLMGAVAQYNQAQSSAAFLRALGLIDS